METKAQALRRMRGVALAIVALAVLPLPFAVGDGTAKAFESPEALVAAMVEAAEKNDDAAMKALVGPEHEDLVQPGGDPTVAKARAEFAANAKTFTKLEDGDDGRKVLVIGDARWPFPLPLVRTDAGWTLDVEAGREEMLARRVGQNELDALRLCRAYLRVQEEYRSKDRDEDGVREYAQRVRSTPGEKDGLWWETGEDGEISPMGPLVAAAEAFLATREPGDPVGGYYWKILKGQGEDAPGGFHSYVINGNMVAGCALVGFPAAYGDTGVMTFLVSHHGDVYEKDLGPATADVVDAMFGFNPDDTWSVVEGN